MAEEFQAGICGETWWNMNPTRSAFPLMSPSSTCSVAANDAGNYSTWQTDFLDLRATRPCVAEETNNNNMVSDVSLGFLDAQKPQQSESANGTSSFLIDSTLQIMGFGLSSPTSSNWNNQSLFHCSGRPQSMEETGLDSSGHHNPQVSSVDANFKAMNQDFGLDQQGLNSVITSSGNLSGGLIPINGSGSYGYPSNLVQSLYDSQPQPQNSSLFTNPSMSFSSSNELSPTFSSILKPAMPKQQLSGLHFSNSTPFWNASAEALHDIRAGVFASSQTQYQTPSFEEKKQNPPSALLNKLKREESPDAAKKSTSTEPALKRPRIETPSPLPTFKVRKEKLGDRITALQQLVSPFGKTDTASVLHEAIDYIKFLHDQVNVLSTPYMKSGAPIQNQQGTCDNVKESSEEDLRRRGLCLVPISSTFPVTNETTVDFWTPTFGSPPMGMGR